jgi:hypothetical protein
LTIRDILQILAGLFCIGIGSFSEYDAIQSFNTFAMILCLPFILIGLCMVLGSITSRNYQTKRTYYAVTNQRIIILINSSNKIVESIVINQIPVLNKTVKKDGSGTIRFDNSGAGEIHTVSRHLVLII